MKWPAIAATVLVLLIVSMAGAMGAATPTVTGAEPSAAALGDIPADYLAVYQATAERYHLDWAVLAAIGKVETDHGRNNHQSTAGAQGPCQFMPATWQLPGIGEGGDIQDPADCIPAMARYLVKGGAPDDYHAAILSYNHAEWYVTRVLEQAARYRGLEVAPIPTGGVRARIVQLATQALSTRTHYSRYSQAGPLTDDPLPVSPARTDCSQFVRAIYLLAGAPDPGLTTWDQIAHGHQVVEPRPGDLLFTPNEDHVEIVVGDGRTIGHGTPSVDYARVSDFPNAFFMEFAGLE